MEMFGRMPVGGIVTATDVTAPHAEAKVEPHATDFQTVLTTVRAGRDLADLIQMGAAIRHFILHLSILIRAIELFTFRLLPLYSACDQARVQSHPQAVHVLLLVARRKVHSSAKALRRSK
jgi:hypothetical protein